LIKPCFYLLNILSEISIRMSWIGVCCQLSLNTCRQIHIDVSKIKKNIDIFRNRFVVRKSRILKIALLTWHTHTRGYEADRVEYTKIILLILVRDIFENKRTGVMYKYLRLICIGGTRNTNVPFPRFFPVKKINKETEKKVSSRPSLLE